MNKVFLYILFFFCFSHTNAQQAIAIFDKQGKNISYEKMIKSLETADVVLYGEIHDNALCHWLELRILKDLEKEKNGRLIVGGEFFEADDQIIIDEFLKGYCALSNFRDEAKLWNNFEEAYLPLLQFSKEENIPFVATNIPRRYASLVAKKGLDSLTLLQLEAFKWIVPLPFEIDKNLPGYKQMSVMSGHALPYMLEAQAIKDATMAYFISQNLGAKTFFHINGSYHSDGFEGIYWYLKQKNPSLKIVTISSREQTDLNNLEKENSNIADFVVCFPEDMIKTK